MRAFQRGAVGRVICRFCFKMALKLEKNLPGLRPGPADPRPGTGCARGVLPWTCMGPCATHEATEPDRAHAARTFDESRSAGPDLNLAACGWRLKCGPNVRLAKKPLTLRTGGFIVVYYTTFYLSVSCLSVCDIVCLYLIALYSRRSQNVSLHWSQRAAHQKVCPMKTREAGKSKG